MSFRCEITHPFCCLRPSFHDFILFYFIEIPHSPWFQLIELTILSHHSLTHSLHQYMHVCYFRPATSPAAAAASSGRATTCTSPKKKRKMSQRPPKQPQLRAAKRPKPKGASPEEALRSERGLERRNPKRHEAREAKEKGVVREKKKRKRAKIHVRARKKEMKTARVFQREREMSL